jgi:hypothetical protein
MTIHPLLHVVDARLFTRLAKVLLGTESLVAGTVMTIASTLPPDRRRSSTSCLP